MLGHRYYYKPVSSRTWWQHFHYCECWRHNKMGGNWYHPSFGQPSHDAMGSWSYYLSFWSTRCNPEWLRYRISRWLSQLFTFTWYLAPSYRDHESTCKWIGRTLQSSSQARDPKVCSGLSRFKVVGIPPWHCSSHSVGTNEGHRV